MDVFTDSEKVAFASLWGVLKPSYSFVLPEFLRRIRSTLILKVFRTKNNSRMIAAKKFGRKASAGMRSGNFWSRII